MEQRLHQTFSVIFTNGIISAGPDKFGALGKILAGAPFHRSQFHNQLSCTHIESAHRFLFLLSKKNKHIISQPQQVPSLAYLLSAALQNDLQLLPCCHECMVLLTILMNLQQVACIFPVL